jgi:putative hemolysin
LDDSEWLAALVVGGSLLVTALIARVGAIGSTISRATLERLRDEAVPRANLLLSMYRPRYALGVTVTFGQSLSIAMGGLAFAFLARSVLNDFAWPFLRDLLSIAVFVLISLLIDNAISFYRREEGSDRPPPHLIAIYYPLYVLLLAPALLLQKTRSLFVSETDTRAIKEEELRQIVETETEEGTIEEEERDMIAGIFEFGETTVKEVMVPRIDMACAEISSKPEDILALIQQKRHSRIPIYRERVDHIEGVVYAKDLLELLSTGQAWTPEGAMRKPYFVPENKKIAELMREFNTNKVHMAIVINEFGGTSGLVTLEDLIEEIVGEIHDEYDQEEQLFQWDEDGRVLVADARLDIADLNLILNIELPRDGYETLGGFIYNHLGRVPGPDETFVFENLTLWVEEVVGQRITTVRIVKQKPDRNKQDKTQEIA